MSDEKPTVQVTFRSRKYVVPSSEQTTLAALGELLQQATSADYRTIKLVVPGVKGAVVPADSPQKLAADVGINSGARLLMIASSSTEVRAVQNARDLPGMAGFDHELKLAMRRRRTGPAVLSLPTGPYTFQRFQTLQATELSPPAGEALKLLQRVAADPGIVGIMQKHRWGVGLLSEMPPEGKVGVSAMCILGYNVNQGQEIALRLRTDDLKGFRRYDRIRETLCHELAHMVWSEHDSRFKELNSQLLRECASFDWTASAGASTLGGPAAAAGTGDGDWVDEDDVMAVTGRMSGRTLAELAGGVSSRAGRPVVEPRAVAAEANTPPRSGASTPEPRAPTTPPATPSPTGPHGQQPESIASSTAELDPRRIAGMGHRDSATEAAEEAARSLGGGESLEQLTRSEEARDAWAAQEVRVNGGAVTPAAADSSLEAEPDASAAADVELSPELNLSRLGIEAAAGTCEPMEIDVPEGSRKSGAVGTGAGEEAAEDSASAGPPGAGVAGPASQSPSPKEGAASVPQGSDGTSTSELAGDGQGQAKGRSFEQGTTGSPDAAASASTAHQGATGAEVGADPARDAGPSLGPALAEAGDDAANDDPAAQRYREAEKAVQRLVDAAGRGEAALTALQTLATILQNVLNAPQEPKFRRVRQQNPRFRERAGQHPGALDVLRVAGFVPEEGTTTPAGPPAVAGGGAEPTMALKRDDPGLLWLALAAVNGGLAQLRGGQRGPSGGGSGMAA